MFELPEEVRIKFNKAVSDFEQKKAVFANLSDEHLVASAKFWMQHCDAPKKFNPDAPVYDSTVWHIILPELLRRLQK